jgi:hypothetical protein
VTPAKDDTPRAAADWLPAEKKSRRSSRKRGSGAGGKKTSAKAESWLPASMGPAEPAPRPDVAAPAKSGGKRNGAELRGRTPNGSGWQPAFHSGNAEELAEIQRIEISVLVRRVEELESELSATRREVANAKRQATRAKKAAEGSAKGKTKAKTAKGSRPRRASPSR